MTRTLRARFDGKVLVPEGPVDLPTGQVLELRIETQDPAQEPATSAARGTLADLADYVESLPSIEDRSNMPAGDGVRNLKHYLYGHPKISETE